MQEIHISNSALVMVWKFSVNQQTTYVLEHMQIHIDNEGILELSWVRDILTQDRNVVTD